MRKQDTYPCCEKLTGKGWAHLRTCFTRLHSRMMHRVFPWSKVTRQGSTAASCLPIAGGVHTARESSQELNEVDEGTLQDSSKQRNPLQQKGAVVTSWPIRLWSGQSSGLYR